MEKQSFAENIIHDDKLCAIVLKAAAIKKFTDTSEKYYFYTPTDFTFQSGIQHRTKGERAEAHFHKPLQAFPSMPVQEFLYILSGSALVELYYAKDGEAIGTKIAEVTLGVGDSIILNTGHSVTFIEDTTCLNIKQGPYRGRDEEKLFISP